MQNQTLIQFFHWYYNEEQNLWTKVANEASHLKEIGVTSVWLPPAYKGSAGGYSVGYDVYDLFDMGEFDQKGSTSTKYGSKAEYQKAIEALHKQEIGVLADVVFNHKAGGDELEKITVRTVDENNRTKFTSDKFEIEAWTKFTFPVRGEQYSNFIWDHHCFSGVDWAEDLKQTAIYSIQNFEGEGFEEVPSTELGNYDYLMFNDIDFRNNAVRDELKYWGEWLVDNYKVDGFRLDAVKHISPDFIIDWIDHLNTKYNRKFFIVAENWDITTTAEQEEYIKITQGRTQIFDSLLHHNFYLASHDANGFDMRTIFDNTLVQITPELAVTFVDNHDSQPLQALESYVDFWFRPLAYAIILLRMQGIPCLFFTDIYGGIYDDKNKQGEDEHIQLVPIEVVEVMSKLRASHAYGLQREHFDHGNCVGWTREGDDEHENSGLAVLLSTGDEGFKSMEIGEKFAGKTFIDALGNRQGEVVIDENGWAEFHCNAGSVSVWVLNV
ncbi:alpha-amylase [Pedobacter changchengzhani]|uniref:Alpha-amylase n=1 Tax=Pedobacter changchengzhani TaxID=2529274 RepID=A0A4R5MMQ6_9SPHI|nr:alpha-amylase [Pedobacter changchengzhani]TDG37040.1 alpha-amylase [Pedobacter changchengzhani]